jgi:mono/diheme cytochrome c family protein
VSFLLVQYCRACHSSTPISGANVPLMTYDDLVAPMPGDPSTSVAAACLARMKSAAAPMPPGTLLSAGDIAPFEAWVAAGTPSEVCATDGNIPDTPMNPYDVPATCTSNSYWTNGDDGSSNMLPGRACIACHSQPGGDQGPRFLFAGTVYPSAHEPDDCNGAGDAVIEVTDADGVVRTATALSSGNFFVDGDPATLPTPITARVLYGGKVLPMATPVTTGDCNTCHTQEGKEGAPGRIILPP